MRGETALVTGATGFIGGRLVEKLVLEEDAEVRLLLRDFSTAARVSRFDVEMVRGDITDTETLANAARGCDVVYHCAHDFAAPERNVAAARALSRACLDVGVRRLVHLSSFSVYEPLPDGVIDESTPARLNGWPYKDSKIRIEQEFDRAAEEDGLPVVMLQPTIVYGPFGSFWTSGPIDFLRRGRVILPDDISGFCNAVYVDDVVDAMLRSADADGVVGEKMLVSAAEPVTWREYFHAYERILGVDSLHLTPAERFRPAGAWRRPRNALEALRREPVRTLGLLGAKATLRLLPQVLPGGVAHRVRKAAAPWRLLKPDHEQILLFRARTTVSIEKARRLLGFEPAFDFDRGMHNVEQYIAWANL